MCGIGGLASFRVPVETLTEEARLIQRRLRHRGPDAEGEALTSRAVLVHTRLILRDAQAGAQPMRSRDRRFALTFNGEIYDAGEIAGASASSEAGALLALWAAEGSEGLPRLNGMFAFFIWDDHRQEGFLVRDRLGIKPVAYSWANGILRFASEAHALVGRNPRAHLPTVLEYLAAPCFSGVAHSAFEGIDYLQPGHWLKVSVTGVELRRWAAPPAGTTLALHRTSSGHDRLEPSEAVTIAAVRDCLAPAIARTLTADVPVGVFLSGGLDSTLLAAGLAASKAPCFSIAFEDQAGFPYAESGIVTSDDAPFVALAREQMELRGIDVPVSRANLERDLDALGRINDALPAWEQELAQYHLAAVARQHVKAVLVGDAADETHYGYHFLLDDAALVGPEIILRRMGTVPIRRDCLTDPIAHFGEQYRSLVSALGGQWGGTREERVLATTLLIQARWLPRLLHNGDIHTMRWSLEPRVPFGDRELLEAAARVTPAVGLRTNVEKWALREACRGLVPEPIRVRRKSALPKDQAAGEVYRRLASQIVDERPALVAALVDLDAVATWLPPERPLSEPERAALFRVIGLASWARHHGIEA
jgi:asparagine synthase (glutamine-hydrolysing)